MYSRDEEYNLVGALSLIIKLQYFTAWVAFVNINQRRDSWDIVSHQVFCSMCSSNKQWLAFDNKNGRVCDSCNNILSARDGLDDKTRKTVSVLCEVWMFSVLSSILITLQLWDLVLPSIPIVLKVLKSLISGNKFVPKNKGNVLSCTISYGITYNF